MSVASDEEADGVNKTEDVQLELTPRTEETSAMTSEVTKSATNGIFHQDTPPTGEDVAADTEEHKVDVMKCERQPKRDPSSEELSNTEESDIGLPLLHRINEALNEAAGILSQSMSPSVFVDEPNSGIRDNHGLVNVVNGNGQSGTQGDIDATSKPANDTCKEVVSDVLNSSGGRADNQSKAIVALPGDTRQMNLSSAANNGDSLIMSHGVDARVVSGPERLRRVCEAVASSVQAEAAVRTDACVWDLETKTLNEYESGAGGDDGPRKTSETPGGESTAGGAVDRDDTDDSCGRERQLQITENVSISLFSITFYNELYFLLKLPQQLI